MTDLNDSSDLLVSYIHFECLLETYTLQEETLEDVLRERDELESVYRQKYEAYKKLKQENRDKKNQLKYMQKYNRQQMEEMGCAFDNVDQLNERLKNQQETCTKIYIEDQQQDDYRRKSAKIYEDIQQLETQFKEETLEDQICQMSLKLRSAKEKEEQLGNHLKNLIDGKIDNCLYGKVPFLQVLAEEYGNIGNVDMINKKIVDKNKNVLFLKAEIEKQKDLLKSLD